MLLDILYPCVLVKAVLCRHHLKHLCRHVEQLELANGLIKVLIIDPDVNALFMVVVIFVHLPTQYGVVVNTDMMTCDVAMAIDWGGALRHSLSLSLTDLPMYSSSQSILSQLYLHYFTLWCCPYPWGPPGDSWWCCLPWSGPGPPPYHKCSWRFCLSPWCMEPPCRCCCGCYLCSCAGGCLVEWLLLLILAWVMLGLWLLLVWSLFETHMGYLHLRRALLMCFSSCSSCALAQTDLALCVCFRKVVGVVPMDVMVCVGRFPVYRG